MNLDDLILASVDDHVVEPPHLFQGRMPAKFADQAPRVVREGDADLWVYGDEVIRTIGLAAVAGRPAEEYAMNPTRFTDMRPGCWDINERVLDMNSNGVLSSMCFPTFCQFAGQLFSRQKDRELAMATVRAYNDWHVDEWAGTHPGRIIPLGIGPLWDAELFAAEVHRLADKGCHAVCFSENPSKLGYPSWHSESWAPLFRACEERGTVLCLHLGSSSETLMTSEDAPAETAMCLSTIPLYLAASDIVFSDVVNAFPKLQIALSEGGIGWIPYFLERADYVYKHHKAWTGTVLPDGMLPSEVFRQRIVTCFIDDAAGLRMRDQLNMDKVCWECDYPHSDSTWPESPELFLASTGGALTAAEINKVTHENAFSIFRFDPFKNISRSDATVGALRAAAGVRDLTFSDGRRHAGSTRLGNPLSQMLVTAE